MNSFSHKILKTTACLALLVCPPATYGVQLSPGDILVTDDRDQTSDPGRIIRVNPSTGVQSIFSEGGHLRWPYGIAIETPTTAVIADYGAVAVIRLNLLAGTQTIVSAGDLFVDPTAITVGRNGTIYVGDASAGKIFKVDPFTGSQTTISSGGHLRSPRGIIEEASGTLLVSDQGANAIIRIDPTSLDDGTGNNQSVVSKDGHFGALKGISLDSAGRIVVADGSGLYRVDGITGAQQLLLASGSSGLDHPYTVEPDFSGRLIVADPLGWPASGTLYRVDEMTGAKTTLTTGGFFQSPLDVAIYSPSTSGAVPESLSGAASWFILCGLLAVHFCCAVSRSGSVGLDGREESRGIWFAQPNGNRLHRP